MTRERAIEVLKAWNLNWSDEFTANEFEQAFAMAIKALEQEPCCNCIEFKRYAKEMGFEIDQESVLDKIRDEIDRQEKWLLQAGYTAYNVDIAFDTIKAVLAESEDME
jgi:hypothetical protein